MLPMLAPERRRTSSIVVARKPFVTNSSSAAFKIAARRLAVATERTPCDGEVSAGPTTGIIEQDSSSDFYRRRARPRRVLSVLREERADRLAVHSPALSASSAADQSGYSSLRQARGSSGPGFGVRSSRNA